MKIIAIDPGYDRLGLAIMSKENGREVLHHSTCVQTDRNDEPTERLYTIGKAVDVAITEHQPGGLAIEKLFFNNNQKTAMLVAEVRGIIRYLARTHHLDLHEYTPQEIKIAMTGHGKSDKKSVIDMVCRIVPGAPEKALDDEYDAIAVGVTCLAHMRA